MKAVISLQRVGMVGKNKLGVDKWAEQLTPQQVPLCGEVQAVVGILRVETLAARDDKVAV